MKGTFDVATVAIDPITIDKSYFSIDYSNLAAPILSFDDGDITASLRSKKGSEIEVIIRITDSVGRYSTSIQKVQVKEPVAPIFSPNLSE